MGAEWQDKLGVSSSHRLTMASHFFLCCVQREVDAIAGNLDGVYKAAA